MGVLYGLEELDVKRSGNVRVQRSNFNFNGEDGIHFQDVGRVNIRWTKANNNSGDGLDVNTAGFVSIKLSAFNDNGETGLNLDNVDDVNLRWVWTVGNLFANYTLDDVVMRP